MVTLKFACFILVAFEITALSDVGGESVLTEREGPVVAMEDSCKDCTQIMALLADMLSNADTQEKIANTLKAFCSRLPGSHAKELCEHEVERNLHLALGILIGFIKSGPICQELGLCKNQSEDIKEGLLTNHSPEVLIPTKKGVASAETWFSPCSLCVLIIEKLEILLPKERSEGAIVQLLDHICVILPHPLQSACNVFISKFGKMLIDLLVSSVSPRIICTVLQLCHGQEIPALVDTPPSDCQSCQTLAILANLYLGSNSTEQQASSFLGSICQLHPHALPKCEVFTQRFGPKLQRVLGKEYGNLDLCGKADLCAAATEARPGDRERCLREIQYRCRDMKTAQGCNSVLFCQKFVWT